MPHRTALRGRIRAFCLGILWINLWIFAVEAQSAENRSAEPSTKPPRLISLAPSVTETIFELNAESHLVGVTTYCKHPPQAAAKTIVGGYMDPSYEKILSLRPDRVLLLTEQGPAAERLRELGVEVTMLDHRAIAGVLESIRILGGIVGEEQRAAALVAQMQRRIDAVRRRVEGAPRPRVIVSVGAGNRPIERVYVAAQHTVFDELLELAGAQNAYRRRGLGSTYPSFSAEGIIALRPDVIIELVTEPISSDAELQQLRARWVALLGREALEKVTLHIMTDEYMIRPGPRVIDALERLAGVLHPNERVATRQALKN